MGRILSTIGRALRLAAWTILFAVLAAGGAGLIGQAWHPPGTPARAELTYAGDTVLGARLDLASARLAEIAEEVDRLADEAKTALAEVTSSDPTRLHESLQRGGQAAATIDVQTRDLREALADLPGGGPSAAVEYGNATLVRRSAVLTALEAASSLAAHWRQVAARATEAANLTALIDLHDQTVLAAADQGRDRRYARAMRILDEALLVVADIQTLRARLIAGTSGTVLDEWIERNSDYDLALRNLYGALRTSGGEVTVEVQFARRDEQLAFERLPPDRRTIVVIVAEVTRGGLTEAVIAIEDARARLDDALVEAG